MTEQCQIDFLVRRFQEIQKDSIEIKDKLEKQKTNFNDLENNDKLNECRYGVLLERLEYLYDKHEKNLIHEGIKHESAQRQIDVIANNHKAQNGTLQALKLFIDELKDRSEKHIELLKTFVTNQAFAETKTLSEKCNKDLNAHSEAFQKFVDAYKFNAESVKKDLSTIPPLKDALQVLEGNLAEMTKILAETQKRHQGDFDQLNKNIDYAKTDLKNQVILQIAAIPRPVMPTIEEMKKILTSHFEPISLESRNSKLQSGNNETRILLLERKIEQLQLLINQISLERSK